MDAQNQPPSIAPAKKPWWRRVRVWLIIVVLALPWLYLAHLAYRVSEQRRAIDMVTKLNGFFEYDFEFGSRPAALRLPPARSNASPPAPPWLVRLLGVDYFANVAWFCIKQKPNDEQWNNLSRLSHLEFINLWYEDGTDRDLAQLENLTGLKRAIVSFKVSDEAIERLRRNLPSLQEFQVGRAEGGWYHFDVRSTPTVTIYPPPTASQPASAATGSQTAK
jgi:hypothetical protein